MLARLKRAIEDPGRVKRAVIRRMPTVISANGRATARRIRLKGLPALRKHYYLTGSGAECFRRELLAREIFRDAPWMLPIKEHGNNWFILPLLPENARLDIAAHNLDPHARANVVRQIMSALLDIHTAGYLHGDFHTRNLYWFENQLFIGDYEKLTTYPDGQRPPFIECFDLAGVCEGLVLPGRSDAPRMYYNAPVNRPVTVERALAIPLANALAMLDRSLKDELRSVCRDFQSRNHRGSLRAQKIYSSFTLPYFRVTPEEAQRDSAKRLARFGIQRRDLEGARLLDLGCNVGGMILEAQSFGPAWSLGVEIDSGKVRTANRIAAHSGLNSVRFTRGAVDRLTLDFFDGPYDVVFCLALVEHLKDKDRLYKLLSQVTKHTLYFEGNSQTDPGHIITRLRASGFADVRHIGACNDDCIPANNIRPLFIARK